MLTQTPPQQLGAMLIRYAPEAENLIRNQHPSYMGIEPPARLGPWIT